MSATKDIAIFFTPDGRNACELLCDALSKSDLPFPLLEPIHIEDTKECSIRPKCALALFAPDVFQSHVALLRFHNIFSKLQCASRFFPIVVADHEKVLLSLAKTLPLIADRRPFLLTEKNAKDFVGFLKAKLHFASPSSIDIKSAFDVATIGSVWPEDEKVVSVSWRGKTLGVAIQNIKDATGKAAAICVRKSSVDELGEGDRLLGLEGYPESNCHEEFLKQLKRKEDSRILLRVRPASEVSKQRLKDFQMQVNRLQDLSLLQKRRSDFKLLILCCAEDSRLGEMLEQRMPRSVSCKRVVVGRNYPNVGTVNFQLLLPILTAAFFSSETAEETLDFFYKKMEKYSSQVLAVSVDQTHQRPSSESFENFTLAKDLSNFSQLSKKIRIHAFAAKSRLVFDIFDGIIESSQSGPDRITLKKERNYPDENLKFRESQIETPKIKKKIAELVSIMNTRPKEAKVKELLDLATSNGYSYSHYKVIHRFSLQHPDLFWGELAEEYDFRVGDTNERCASGSLRQNVISKTFFEESEDKSHNAVTVLPGRKTNLCANMLDRWAGETPKVDKSKHTALIFVPTDRSLSPVRKTYEELLWATKKCASFLENTVKLTERNRALVCMEESPARVVVLLACLRIGVTVGAEDVNDLKSVERTFKMSHSDVKIGMSESDMLKIHVIKDERNYFFAVDEIFNDRSKVEHSPKWLSTTHTAFFSTTSGTTTKSKVVEHLAGSFIVGAGTNMRYLLDFNLIGPGNDICLVTSDMCWVYGFTIGFCTPLLNGGAIVRVANMTEALKSRRIWSIVADCGVTHFCSVPRIIGNLADEIGNAKTLAKMESLQVITSAGDRLYDKGIKTLMKFLRENGRKIKLYDIYGQTETAAFITLSSCCDVEDFNNHPKKMVPFYGVSARIKVQPNRNTGCAPHRVLVYDKPFPGCFSRYVDHDDEYEKTFSDEVYNTGDSVEYQLEQTHEPADSPRTFIIVGRKESVLDFMTPVRPYSVSAEDVEELCCHKDIKRTRAFTFKKGERNVLGLQVETKREMDSSAKEKLQEELREKIHELRNLVDDDRNLEIKFDFIRAIDETRGKTVRKDLPLLLAQV